MADLLLTVTEAADHFRVDPETVRRWLRSGQLQGQRATPESRKWLVVVPEPKMPDGMSQEEYTRQMIEMGLDVSTWPEARRRPLNEHKPTTRRTTRKCQCCEAMLPPGRFFKREGKKRDTTCLDCLSPTQKYTRGLISDLEYRQTRKYPQYVGGYKPKRDRRTCRACNTARGIHRFPRVPDLCEECDDVHKAERQIEKLIAAGKASVPVRFEKACSRCRHLLPLTAFDFKSEATWTSNFSPYDKRKEICRDCRAGRTTSESVARRVELLGRHTPAQWEMLCYVLGYRCVGCEDVLPLTHDHILPISSEGSTHFIGNMQPLCQSCNSTKGAKHLDLRPCPIRAEWFEGLPDTTPPDLKVGARALTKKAWTFSFPAPPYVYDWGLGHLVENDGAPPIELVDGWRKHCMINFSRLSTGTSAGRAEQPKARPRKPDVHIRRRDKRWQVRHAGRSIGTFDGETARAVEAELKDRLLRKEEPDPIEWLEPFLDRWYRARPELRPKRNMTPSKPARLTDPETHGHNRTYRPNLKPVEGPLEQSDVPGVSQDRKSGDWRVYYRRPRASVQPGQRRVVYLTMFRDKELAEAVALEAARRCNEEGHEPEDKSWIRDFVALLDSEEAGLMMIRKRRMREGFVPKYADPNYSDLGSWGR